ncbi:MAG: hypothetical protein AVDCRST_MAG13-1567, partial [uncultured Solirubrobacteraceae bacterium]
GPGPHPGGRAAARLHARPGRDGRARRRLLPARRARHAVRRPRAGGRGPRPALRPLARADRAGLRRGPLLLAPGLSGAGHRLPGVGPAGERVGPVRHGRLGDRLLRRLGERHLVRAGRGAHPRPRRRPRARARPRAGHLARVPHRLAVAVLDAAGDARLHLARPLAPQRGSGM